LSHRKLTATIAFVTGHEDRARRNRHRLARLARGIGRWSSSWGEEPADIVSELTATAAAGNAGGIGALGTTPEQVTVSGTLADIVDRVKQAGLRPRHHRGGRCRRPAQTPEMV
jgi:uroporphyrinogen III methyltransferase/synthase